MVLSSLLPSSLTTLLVQKPLFLENRFTVPFYLETPLSFTSHPDQTNVFSHIFVLMYLDRIVKWKVINNVNMFFSE